MMTTGRREGQTILLYRRCHIKEGWFGFGKSGWIHAACYFGQEWGLVKWDDEDDPAVFKMAGLEIEVGSSDITNSEYRNLIKALYPKNKKP